MDFPQYSYAEKKHFLLFLLSYVSRILKLEDRQATFTQFITFLLLDGFMKWQARLANDCSIAGTLENDMSTRL